MTGLGLILWRRGYPLLLTIWLHFVITLIPVIGLVQVGWQAAADRFTYIPTMPFFTVIGLGVAMTLLGKVTGWFQQARRAGVFLIVLATFWLLAEKSMSQTRIWKSNETLWQYALLENPGHWAIQSNVAFLYLQRGDLLAARQHYLQSLALFAFEDSRYAILGDIQKSLGNLPEARDLYLELTRRTPQNPTPFQSLGDINLAMGQLEEALSAYRRSLQNNANNPAVKLGLVGVYLAQNQGDLARSSLNQLLIEHPEFDRAKQLLKKLQDQDNPLQNPIRPEW